MLADIRAFFHARDVLEVETPLLASHGVSAPGLFNWSLEADGNRRYLQTSPEYAMKRLLAAGIGDCYQITRAFRGLEYGRVHNPEFTMLEWYRLGFDHHQLMAEVDELLHSVLSDRLVVASEHVSYAELFVRHTGMHPMSSSEEELEDMARQKGVLPDSPLGRDALLDLLLSLIIAPELPGDRLTYIHSWPMSQAALARTLAGSEDYAARFEVFCGDMELANGYWELTDATEQARRFELDNQQRQFQRLQPVAPDPLLLEALEAGMPDCAGVSIGLDRVLMIKCGAHRIDEVVAFPWPRS